MKSLVAGLVLGGGIAAVLVGSCNARRQSARETAMRSLGAQNEILKAENAELAVRASQSADTVRVYVKRTMISRDTLLLHLTDTVLVKSYIYQTDTLRAKCMLCAARSDSLRYARDKEIPSLTSERDDWRRMYEHAAYPKCGRGCGIVIGASLTALGALYLNETRRALRP